MRILSFSGKAHHGKDTCVKFALEALQEAGLRAMPFSFAASLKARVYGEAGGTISLDDILYHKPPEVRKLLQEVGTERGRNVFGPEFWTLQAEAILQTLYEGSVDVVVMSDVRFSNEVEFVARGGKARVPTNFVYTEDGAFGMEVCPRKPRFWGKQRYLKRAADFYVKRMFDTLAHRDPMLSKLYWIYSDRTTLSGEAAKHISETYFDQFNKYELFDEVVNNAKYITLDVLKANVQNSVRTWLKESYGT